MNHQDFSLIRLVDPPLYKQATDAEELASNTFLPEKKQEEEKRQSFGVFESFKCQVLSIWILDPDLTIPIVVIISLTSVASTSSHQEMASSKEFVWGDMSRQVAKIAHDKDLIDTAQLDTISKDEADKLTTGGGYLWGTNSRCRSIRANKLFDWTPKQKSMSDLLPEIIDNEATKLGLLKTHLEEALTGTAIT